MFINTICSKCYTKINFQNKQELLAVLLWWAGIIYRNWRDHKRTGTHKHMETVSRYFDWHGRLSQPKESKCLWTHDKDGVTREFTKGATRGCEKDGWREIIWDWERRPCQSKYLDTVSACLCVSVLLWSLQFLVRVFTFLSLNLWFSYFGTFLSTWLVYFFIGLVILVIFFKQWKIY